MHVTLRPRTDDDLDVLFALEADLATWEERSPRPPAPLSRTIWEDRLRSNDQTSVQFVIDVDGAPAGAVSLFSTDPLARHAEIGIAVAPEFRGQGVGTEAVRLMVEFAFVRANLRRVHLEAIASNVAAVRAYEKAGFVLEGRQREHAWVRGRYEDIVRMGILRAEWHAKS